MLLVIGASLFAALVPGGLLLDRRLSSELREKARSDLLLAPVLLADRNRSTAYALGMRTEDLATNPALRRAVQNRAVGSAEDIVEAAQDSLTAESILIGAAGDLWEGIPVAEPLLRQVLQGKSVNRFAATDRGLRRMALAPIPALAEPGAVRRAGDEPMPPVGVAGLTLEVGAAEAGALAGLTRSEVLILDAAGRIVAASGDSLAAESLSRAASSIEGDRDVHVVDILSGRWWISTAPLDGAGRVVFARHMSEELAVLPELRRGAAFAVAFALGVALLVGGLFARAIVGPVETLARAADRLASGRDDTPVERSRILEVDRLGQAFSDMRKALASKMNELEQANRELAARQRRLTILQAEMIQRDRLAAGGRLVAELAHEIRNPVAGVRNCLELVRRKLDERDREFADLAIDELLRMHELAEHMLDLNRPSTEDASCEPTMVVEKIAELMEAGSGAEQWRIRVAKRNEAVPQVAISQDALKQVLLNLVENAREAMPGGGAIDIAVAADDAVVTLEVGDQGPGIPERVLPQIFDPFFTTKAGVRGVGLGLFIAEGIVRRHGGAISGLNRQDGAGAIFRIELPRVEAASPEVAMPA